MRALPRGLMVLGVIGIAVAGICGGNEGVKNEIIAQERATREIASSTSTSINKVVIGVLDVETGHTVSGDIPVNKNAVMRELKRNTRVKLVDIDESCSLSDLKRHGYTKAEKYKMDYQLDMILHTYYTGMPSQPRCSIYFNLIDLYMKRAKEVSIETDGAQVEFALRGISRKLLVSQDLNRVLGAKKEALEKKEVAVSPEAKEIPKREVKAPPKEEVKESPQEIEGFLIQKGPTLIAEGEYNRVLDLMEDLPRSRRRHIQIQTLECFANLKGWVSDRNQSCKSGWWRLRQKLINSGDNEATPMLVVFLKDEDPWLRVYAAELLGHIGDKRALKDLRAAGENDENYKVRKYAKRAYERIFGEKF